MEAKDYLIAIRDHGKLTQDQIAERSGIPQPTISKILRGEVKDVMSRNYRALQSLYAEVIAQPRADSAEATDLAVDPDHTASDEALAEGEQPVLVLDKHTTSAIEPIKLLSPQHAIKVAKGH